MPRFPPCALGAAVLVALAAPSSLAAAPLTAAQARQQLAAGDLDQLYLAAAPLAHAGHADPALVQLLVQAAQQALAKGDASLAFGLADLARTLDPKRIDACLAAADAAEKLQQPDAVQDALDQALRLAPRDGALLVRAGAAAERDGDLSRALSLFQRVPAADAHASEARTAAARVQAAIAQRESDRAAQKRFDDEARARREAATKAAQALAPADAPESAHFRLRRGEGVTAAMDAARLAPFEKAYAQVIESFGHAPEGHVTVRLVSAAERAKRCRTSARVCLSEGELLLDPAVNQADRVLEAEAANAFTRAVIEGLAGGKQVPAWLVEGLALWHERKVAGQPAVGDSDRRLLADTLRLKAVPRLALLGGSFAALGAAQPLAQAKSVAAVEALLREAGAGKRVAHLLVHVGGGASFEEAFAAEIAPGRLAKLDAEAEALAK